MSQPGERMGEATELPLAEIATRLRERAITSEALVQACIDNRNRAAATFDAYCHWAPETALAMARTADEAFAAGRHLGGLHGIPVSIKDLFALDGMPFYAGSPRRLPARFEAEGPLVGGLRRQGAVFMGKTHTSELGFGVCGANIHWGTPRNPWDPVNLRPAGGSSSGAAISLIEGSALAALGSDTGGSAREPANMTGIVGLKVSHGRWSGEGLVPPGPSLHGPGLLARSVADTAFTFAAIDEACPPGWFDQSFAAAPSGALRIGILDDYFWADCAPGVAEAVSRALDELSASSIRLVATPLPQARQLAAVSADWDWGVSAVELLEFLESELPEWLTTLHPGARCQLEVQSPLTAVEYLRRLRLLRTFAAAAEAVFVDVDVLACPTSPVSPPRLEELSDPETYRRISRLAARNTSVVNLLDLCALTMPVGLDAAGLPVGLQLIASHGQDAKLLSAAGFVERCLGTGRARIGVAPLRQALEGDRTEAMDKATP
jgi:aspartyl-tRNA(Asn)/glutamyl-tRNA(Gln) amidotransferase subunit A